MHLLLLDYTRQANSPVAPPSIERYSVRENFASLIGKPTGSRHPSRPDQNNKGHQDLHSTAHRDLSTPDLPDHHRRDHPDPSSEVRRGHRTPDRQDHHSDRRRDCASMDRPDRHRPDPRGHCRQAHRDRNNRGRPGRHSLCSYRYRGPWLTTRTLPAPRQSVAKGFSCCPLWR